MINRRHMIQRAAFTATAIATPGLFAEELTKTAFQTEGPFYPNKLPLDTDNDLLIINDKITFFICSFIKKLLQHFITL